MSAAAQTLAPEAGTLDQAVTAAPYLVSREEIAAYARATNDSHPQHLSGELAPPSFAIVPVMRTMVAAKKLVTPAFGFHGEHDFWFHRPIRPGMKLLSRARVHGVQQRSSGVAIAVRIETSDGEGIPVNEQYFVSFVPKARSAADIGQPPPPHAMPAGTADHPPTAAFFYVVDPDQAHRFAEASDDRDPYTTDEAAARAMGFATPILHGTCILAFAGRAAIDGFCAGDPLRLRRFAARLTNPLGMIAGQKIVTRLWRGEEPGRVGYFVSADATGTPVLTNGWVEAA